MRRLTRKEVQWIGIFSSILFSLLLFLGAIYIAYLQTYQLAANTLQEMSERVLYKYVNIFSKFNKSIHNMLDIPVECNDDSLHQLQVIALNDPNISMTFLTRQKSICSNIGKMRSPFKIVEKSNKLVITGPKRIPEINERAFILSLKHKGHHYGIVTTEEVLKRAIPADLNRYFYMSLVKMPQNHILVKAGHLPIKEDNQTFEQLKNIHSDIKVPLFKNVYLVSGIQNAWVWHELTLHIVILAAIALIVCTMAVYIIYRITKRRLSLRAEIQRALLDKEFIAHYQPVIDLQSNQATGVECLIRWKPPGEDLIYPDTFLPTAERAGLIHPITIQLIKLIFKELGDYAHHHPHFHIAINLTPQNFYNNDILLLTKKLCAKYQVKQSQILFELTEQELFDEANMDSVEIMQAMREEGFSLALDDFGTGYASINYLQRFPFNYLKIDKHFVIAIGSGAITEGIADSMVSMAKRLDLKVIAEGVDDVKHKEHLVNQGVEYAQGWFYAKALPWDKAQAFITEYNTP